MNREQLKQRITHFQSILPADGKFVVVGNSAMVMRSNDPLECEFLEVMVDRPTKHWALQTFGEVETRIEGMWIGNSSLKVYLGYNEGRVVVIDDIPYHTVAETQRCGFTDYADYVFNKDHIWEPTKFLQSRKIGGASFGVESQLYVQYCHGNSYMEGYIGDRKIRVFGSSLQGYQVYLWPSEVPFEDIFGKGQAPKFFNPDRKDKMIEYVRQTVS